MLVKFAEFWPLSFIESNHGYLVANDEKKSCTLKYEAVWSKNS
jgi:hypothetical protein